MPTTKFDESDKQTDCLAAICACIKTRIFRQILEHIAAQSP